MPGTTATPDIELIIENTGGGGGGRPPAGGDGGDDGDYSRRRKWSPSPRRYSTGIAIALVSILMFFMALSSAFIVLRRGSDAWVSVHLPRILWLNTCVLLGRVGALLYVSFRKFEKANILLSHAAEITSYYWHFMDGLWIFLLALLYLGT